MRVELDDPGDYVEWCSGSGGSVELRDIAVNSERGVGKGRRLVAAVLEHLPVGCRLVWAATRCSNVGASAFYRALGFRFLGMLDRFYGDEAAAVWGLDV